MWKHILFYCNNCIAAPPYIHRTLLGEYVCTSRLFIYFTNKKSLKLYLYPISTFHLSLDVLSIRPSTLHLPAL